MLFKQLLIQKSYSNRANKLRSFKRSLKRNVTGSAFCFVVMLLAFSVLTTLSMQSVYAQDSTKQTVADTTNAATASVSTGGATPEIIAQGQELFAGNCAQCHAVHKKVVGPALDGAEGRWGSRAATINFIKYPEKTINSGDVYAKKLYDEYQQYMPNHDFFSDAQVASILDYIKTVPVPVAAVAATSAGDGGGDDQKDGTANSGLLLGIVIALIAILLVVALILVVLTSVLSGYLQKERLEEDENLVVTQSIFDFKAFFTSAGFVGVVLFVLVAVGAKELFAGLWTIGVQQGYAPTQPIKFSHKLHAGYYEIDCKFCHSGVEKGKSAVIPSANVCMNCHGEIRRGSPEIQKIYNAKLAISQASRDIKLLMAAHKTKTRELQSLIQSLKTAQPMPTPQPPTATSISLTSSSKEITAGPNDFVSFDVTTSAKADAVFLTIKNNGSKEVVPPHC